MKMPVGVGVRVGRLVSRSRRPLSVAATLALIAGGLAGLAPAARASENICYRPGGVLVTVCAERDAIDQDISNGIANTQHCASLSTQYLCGKLILIGEVLADEALATGLQEYDTLNNNAHNCESLQPQYLCGQIFNLAIDELHNIENQYGNTCQSGSGGLCDNALKEAGTLQRDIDNVALQCSSLSTQYLCGQVVATVVATTYEVVGIAKACQAGDNTTCQTALDEVNALEQAGEKCVNMTAGTLCPSTVQLVEAVVFAVVATGEACANGSNVTCESVLQAAQNLRDEITRDLSNCISGESEEASCGQAVAEVAALASLVRASIASDCVTCYVKYYESDIQETSYFYGVTCEDPGTFLPGICLPRFGFVDWSARDGNWMESVGEIPLDYNNTVPCAPGVDCYPEVEPGEQDADDVLRFLYDNFEQVVYHANETPFDVQMSNQTRHYEGTTSTGPAGVTTGALVPGSHTPTSNGQANCLQSWNSSSNTYTHSCAGNGGCFSAEDTTLSCGYAKDLATDEDAMPASEAVAEVGPDNFNPLDEGWVPINDSGGVEWNIFACNVRPPTGDPENACNYDPNFQG